MERKPQFVRDIDVNVPLIKNTFWPNCGADVFTLSPVWLTI